jgi:hypothetical protein
MALDLSGFALPEQKFEGLYKLADTYRENKALEQKQQQLEAEAAKEARKEEQARLTADYIYLQDAFDNKKYATGNPFDDEYINAQLKEKSDKYQNLFLTNKNLGINEMRAIMKSDMDGLWDQSLKLKQVNNLAEEAKKNNIGKAGVDPEAIYNNIRNYYLKDDKGIPKTDFSTLKVNPDDLPSIVMQGNVYNHGSFDNFVQKSGTQPRTTSFTDKVGNKTVSKTLRTNAPTSFILEKQGTDIVAVPKYEIATDDGVPAMHTVINDGKPEDKEIRMVDEDIFNQFTPEMKSFLDQETKKYAAQLGKEPTPTQKHQFQKALAYYQLENSSKLSNKVEKVEENKINITNNQPSEKLKEALKSKDDLFAGLDTETPDTDGNLDITSYMPDVKAFGQIKAGQGVSVKYNPGTKQITIIDTDNQSHSMPFSKFISTITTANTKDDREYIRMIGGYKGKGSAAPAASTNSQTSVSNALSQNKIVNTGSNKKTNKKPKIYD